MTDSPSSPTPPDPDAVPPKYTKEPQPDLPLAERREKAGITKNRVILWIGLGGIGAYMLITGLVGILTKAR